MITAKYSLSFTTDALFYQESVKVMELFSQVKKWEKVREAAIAENIVPARTLHTLKCVTSELISRLKMLCKQKLAYRIVIH